MSTPAQIPPDEIRRIASNPQGFGELTEPYRRELQIHCYRILGSLHEAEDMVQETFIKAWKHIGTYEDAPPSAPGFTKSPPTPAWTFSTQNAASVCSRFKPTPLLIRMPRSCRPRLN